MRLGATIGVDLGYAVAIPQRRGGNRGCRAREMRLHGPYMHTLTVYNRRCLSKDTSIDAGV